MILIIDNTKDLEVAKMTPEIVNIVRDLNIDHLIISKKQELLEIVRKKVEINGIILSGGPLCLTNGCNYNDISKNILAINIFKDIPILGICFGFQVMCDIYGSKIYQLDRENTNIIKLDISSSNLMLMEKLPKISKFFFSHNDYIQDSPANFNCFKYNDMIIGVENQKMKRYGFQFHPEGTPDGKMIIRSFLKIC